MSSYIVDDKTINKIVSHIFAKALAPDSSIRWEATKLAKMGYSLTSAHWCSDLAHKMFDMNVAAVKARYGVAEVERYPYHVFKYLFTPATQIEVIKALKAWKYQCTEGRVSELALYKAMVEVHCLLCIDFVEQTEEYEAAPWG
jgi:hypothetical protein